MLAQAHGLPFWYPLIALPPSIVLKSPVDVTAAAIYATELALWIGIMLAGFLFALRDIFHARMGSEQDQGEPRIYDNSPESEVATRDALGMDVSPHQASKTEAVYHRSVFAGIRKRLPVKLAHRLEERQRVGVDSNAACP
jgi:hypothetical protein